MNGWGKNTGGGQVGEEGGEGGVYSTMDVEAGTCFHIAIVVWHTPSF